MTDKHFRDLLVGAIAGDHSDLEKILELYEPLVSKHSYIDGNFDEDLHQYIMIRIALNISKFSI